MSSAPYDEYQNRIRKARELMMEQDVNVLIVTDPVSYYYFSGHRVPASKSRPSVMILPLDGEAKLITWEMEELWTKLDNTTFQSWVKNRQYYPEVPFSAEKSTDWGIRSTLEELSATRDTIAIEMGQDTRLGLPINDFMRLKNELPDVKFVDSGSIVWGCRLIKSEWEINALRKACEIGGKAWQKCFENLREGISSREIKKMLFQYYLELGADSNYIGGFARGGRGPGGSFKKGDVLYLDGGCSYMGYEMDITRRAVFGEPSERQKREHKIAWEILFKVMEAMKPGIRMGELFELSNEEIRKTGFENYSNHPAKRIGHGIGLENEPPSINAVDRTVLQEGMVLTPEPKFISVDGLVNPEEQVVITQNGCKLLSTIPSPELFIVR